MHDEPCMKNHLGSLAPLLLGLLGGSGLMAAAAWMAEGQIPSDSVVKTAVVAAVVAAGGVLRVFAR